MVRQSTPSPKQLFKNFFRWDGVIYIFKSFLDPRQSQSVIYKIYL